MNKPRKSFSLIEAKIQTSILLKSLHSPNKEIAMRAAKRFQRLPEFASCVATDIPEKDIKRKHALAIIAIENGFKSWADLKFQISFMVGGFLNKWFTNYQEAKAHQQSNGGFLFPYKSHFFICEAGYIKHIGLDPDDPDWKLISFDWVEPSDKKTWQRLYKKWMKIQEDSHE